MTAALVVGKFYPPHRGHTHLVRRALELRPHVVILCLGSARDSLTPTDRAGALLEDLEAEGVARESVTISAGYDETPFDLHDEAIWRSHVETFRAHLRRAPEVDLLVSSEAYGDELAARLGIDHALVDIDRGVVPTSASDVRRDVVGNWGMLGPGGRRLMAVRVVILGAESTGTTTVARLLAERLRERGGSWAEVQWVTEYGHELTEAKQRIAAESTGLIPLSVDWGEQDFRDVIAVQTAREDAAAALGGPVLVCDTDAFATPVWERRYLGQRASLDAGVLGRGDVYLLTHHEGVPFVQDGTRDGEHIRERMTDDFAAALVEHGKPWVMLTGSLEERLALAERVVDDVSRRKFQLAPPI
jgi:NadR type nicotinamide-nucleotide adenylyltransferase